MWRDRDDIYPLLFTDLSDIGLGTQTDIEISFVNGNDDARGYGGIVNVGDFHINCEILRDRIIFQVGENGE